jgi:hypothetical protein
MVRILIAAATFVAVCAVTLANVSAAEPQRANQATSAPATASTVQVYTNPG